MRVIAIGSPFNDDSIAWRCVEDIEHSRDFALQNVDVNYCNSPASELIHLLHRHTPTVLVDALLDENHSGQVKQLSLDELDASRSVSSHGFSVAQMLQLAGRLNYLPEALWIIGITVSDTEMLTDQQVGTVKLQLFEHIKSIAENY